MTGTTAVRPHPITDALATAREALREARDLQAMFLTTEQKETALRHAAALEAEAAALRLRITAVAGDVAEATACRDVAAWQSTRLQADVRKARADERLAHALDTTCPIVADALAAGRASLDQARVVVDALGALPTDLPVESRERAEADLVAFCSAHPPGELKILGKSILDHVAPEIAEETEARRLLDEEASAWKRAKLEFRPQGDGTTRLSALLPDATAARLRTYLEAFTSPRGKTGDPVDDGKRIPYSRKLAHAFVHLLERLDPARLPEHGGDATTVIVTVGLEQLKTELAAASLLDLPGLEDAANLSAAEARRLACTAKIIPAVLGTHSEVLDLGRADRLFRPPQRRALRLRDRHCRAEGCSIPATWCEAHHSDPWAQGGRTDLADGVLLCSFHHHRAHDPAYQVEKLPDRTRRFVRKR